MPERIQQKEGVCIINGNIFRKMGIKDKTYRREGTSITNKGYIFLQTNIALIENRFFYKLPVVSLGVMVHQTFCVPGTVALTWLFAHW